MRLPAGPARARPRRAVPSTTTAATHPPATHTRGRPPEVGQRVTQLLHLCEPHAGPAAQQHQQALDARVAAGSAQRVRRLVQRQLGGARRQRLQAARARHLHHLRALQVQLQHKSLGRQRRGGLEAAAGDRCADGGGS